MENNLYKKAHAFAIRVVKAYQFLSDEKKEFVLSKQLLKSWRVSNSGKADLYITFFEIGLENLKVQ